MKLSFHRHIRGKPAQQIINDKKVYFSNGRKVSLGFDWQTKDVSWQEAFKSITEDGFATSAELASENRTDANFVSRQLFMVDIDSGMTIEELLADKFYNDYAAGFYTTPSHTDSNHRFRIAFITETPVIETEYTRLLIKGLMRVYKSADPACKDAARLFYGTPNCAIKEYRTAILPDRIANEIICNEISIKEQQRQQTNVQNHGPLNDDFKQHVLELLKRTYIGNYNDWRDIGWGLKQAGFSLENFQWATQGMMKEKTAEDARIVWNDGRAINGGITFGTVIYHLKERHGEDCLKINTAECKLIAMAQRLKLKYQGE